MSKVVDIEGVDYGPDSDANVVSIAPSPASAPGQIGTCVVVLQEVGSTIDILDKDEIKIYDESAGTISYKEFGGFVSGRTYTRAKGTNQRTITLTCQDYNLLLDTIVNDAAPAFEISLVSGTFPQQIENLVEAITYAGATPPNKMIDAVNQVVDFGVTMPAVVLPAGKKLRWYVQFLCNTVQQLDPDIRPGFHMAPQHLADSGTSDFGVPQLCIYDRALPPAVIKTFSDVPGVGEYGIREYERTLNGSGVITRRQAIRPWPLVTYVKTYQDTTSNVRPCRYINHGRSGDMGDWMDEPVEDRVSNTEEEIEAFIKKHVLARSNSRETQTLKIDSNSGTRVSPGDGIAIEWALEGLDPASAKYRALDASTTYLTPTFYEQNITLAQRKKWLGETSESEDILDAPIEGDIIPPAPPTDLANVSVFQPVPPATANNFTWTASTSADVNAYRLVLRVGPDIFAFDIVRDPDDPTGPVPTSITLTLPLDTAYTAWLYSIDGHGNVCEAPATVAGTTANYPTISPPASFTYLTPYADPATGLWTIPLVWTATPTTDYLDGYFQHKSTDGGTTWVKIPMGTALTDFVTANPGQTIMFKMTAEDWWHNPSTFTDPITVTTPLNINDGIANGDFEDVAGTQPDSSASVPYRWERTETNSGTARIELLEVKSGIRSVKFNTTPASATATITCEKASVVAGRTVTWGFWVKGASAANILTAKIHWYSWNGTAFSLIRTDTPYSNAAVTTTWAKKLVYKTAPAGAIAATLEVGKLVSSSVHLYLDLTNRAIRDAVGGRIAQDWVPVVATGASAELSVSEIYTGTESMALGLAPVVATPVDPSTITGLGAWYKPEGITGLVNNDPVGSWPDSSGNSRTASQATAGAKPTYKTDGPNGLARVAFATDDFLATAAFGAPLAQPNSILMVVRMTPNGVQQHMLDGLSGTARHIMYVHSTDKYSIYAGTSELISGVTPSGAYTVLSAIFNGASSTHRVNGGTATTGNAGAQSLDGITLGNGEPGSAGVAYTGDLVETLVYDTSLSGADRDALENYLNYKYNLNGGGILASTTSEVLGPKTPAAAGSYYSFWGAIKGTLAAGTFTYAVKWFDKSDVLISTSTVFTQTPTTGGFVEGKEQLLAPAGTAYFVESAKYVGTAAATVYFDTKEPIKAIGDTDVDVITTPSKIKPRTSSGSPGIIADENGNEYYGYYYSSGGLLLVITPLATAPAGTGIQLRDKAGNALTLQDGVLTWDGDITATGEVQGDNVYALNVFNAQGQPGVDGSFTDKDGNTVIVTGGIITALS